jgi:exosortase
MTTPTAFQLRGGRPVEHHVCFLLFGVLSLIVLWTPLSMLLTLSLHDDRYSHVLIVPLISLALVFFERRTIFRGLHFSPLQSAPFFLLAGIAYWASGSASSSLEQNDRLSLVGCVLIATCLAGFVLCYGTKCFHAALFPLLFLLLMIPLPSAVIDRIILWLQEGSAVVAYKLFRAFGVPVFWSGFTFALPGVDIEIAKECSGIRSTISLLITGMVAGHLFLRSTWRQVLLSALTIPVAIFKNAVRIVTISCLGVYGGVPFALIALAIIGPSLLLLQRAESKSQKSKNWKLAEQRTNAPAREVIGADIPSV